MDKDLFEDLVQSIKELKAVKRGEMEPSRRFRFPKLRMDVKQIREKLGLSQSEFASLMRVSIRTLQNWEQHRRNPTGPAAALLKIVAVAPDVVLKALNS